MSINAEEALDVRTVLAPRVLLSEPVGSMFTMSDRDAQHPVAEAVRAWWAESRGRPAASFRREAVAPLMQLITDELVKVGVDHECIHTDLRERLPSAYSTTGHRWDLVVLDDGVPLAAIDVVSQGGVGFANNLRNRVSEAISRSVELLRPYQSSSVANLAPFVGLVFVAEESPETTRPIRDVPRLLDDPAGTAERHSMIDRCTHAFRNLIADNFYDGICFITIASECDYQVREPYQEMGFANLIQMAAGRVSELRRLKHDAAMGAIEFGRALARRNDIADVISGLVSTPEGLSVAETAVVSQRRKIVAELPKLALDTSTNETTMQKALQDLYWIFGGRYIGVAERRDLMPMDQHDIPLICADGSLEIVELKGPGSKIVERHRNHFIVSDEVHKAVGQCMNYLRSLDEVGMGLQTVHKNDLGFVYDYRRAGGIVVIGHPDRADSTGIERQTVEQTIRSYNSHLTRVQVLTYADLLDTAGRALDFERGNTCHR